VTSYSYVFAFDTSQLRGGHQLRPGGQATVIRQVFALSELGLAPTANSPGSGSQTSHTFSSCTSTWTSYSLQASFLPTSSSQLTAAAGTYLRLRQPTALGGTDVAVAPGGGRHIALFSHVDLSFYIRYWDTGTFGPGF
jgi:hypothetical protein